jgi:C-terminal processing protease CtpA/Prc
MKQLITLLSFLFLLLASEAQACASMHDGSILSNAYCMDQTALLDAHIQLAGLPLDVIEIGREASMVRASGSLLLGLTAQLTEEQNEMIEGHAKAYAQSKHYFDMQLWLLPIIQEVLLPMTDRERSARVERTIRTMLIALQDPHSMYDGHRTMPRPSDIVCALEKESLVDSTLYPGSIRYVRLANFDKGVTALLQRELEDEPTGLIIDMRGDCGGDLDESEAMAQLFLSEDFMPIRKITTYTLVKSEEEEQVDTGVYLDMPIVGITSYSTASAPEGFSQAMLGNGRMSVVGQPTYGKTVIQSKFKLTNGKILIFTTGKWFPPIDDHNEDGNIIPDRYVDVDTPDCEIASDIVVDGAVCVAYHHILSQIK